MNEEYEELSKMTMFTALCGNIQDGFHLVGLWTDEKEAEAWMDRLGDEYILMDIYDHHEIDLDELERHQTIIRDFEEDE